MLLQSTAGCPLLVFVCVCKHVMNSSTELCLMQQASSISVLSIAETHLVFLRYHPVICAPTCCTVYWLGVLACSYQQSAEIRFLNGCCMSCFPVKRQLFLLYGLVVDEQETFGSHFDVCSVLLRLSGPWGFSILETAQELSYSIRVGVVPVVSHDLFWC